MFHPLKNNVITTISEEDIILLKEWSEIWDLKKFLPKEDYKNIFLGRDFHIFWNCSSTSIGGIIGLIYGNLFMLHHGKSLQNVVFGYAFRVSCIIKLWKRGIIPSFDGKIWKLHSGEKAIIIWKGIL